MPPLPGDVQWFPADIRRLIAAIKKEEVLWHPKHEGFGMREQQARGWRAVADEVAGGKTDTQCRDKWNCLRGTYRRHVRTENSNSVRRRSGWPWSENMTFLKPYVMERDDPPLRPPYSDDKWRSNSTPPPLVKASGQQLMAIPTSTANSAILTNSILNGGIFLAQGPGNVVKFVPTTSQAGTGVVKFVPTTQGNVTMKVVPSSQSGVKVTQNVVKVVPSSAVQPGLRLVPTTVGVVQPSTAQSKRVDKRAAVIDPIEVDLKKVKPDPDSPSLQTEFVDMSSVVKKEPIEEEEEEAQFPEDDFLPEDTASQTSQSDSESRQGPEPDKDKSREAGKETKESQSTESKDASDSNEMFMRSTVAHMRKMTDYQQSVFKLKVQQLLHEVMFPGEK